MRWNRHLLVRWQAQREGALPDPVIEAATRVRDAGPEVYELAVDAMATLTNSPDVAEMVYRIERPAEFSEGRKAALFDALRELVLAGANAEDATSHLWGLLSRDDARKVPGLMCPKCRERVEVEGGSLAGEDGA